MANDREADHVVPAPPGLPECSYVFPPVDQADEHGIVAVGGDLEPGTVLEAYRRGLFPMPLRGLRRLAWWSPDPRGVIRLGDLRVSRSLRRSCRRFQVRVNTAFEAVIDGCADPNRPHGWISADIRQAYLRLHQLGWAHSVETWEPDSDTLVGGLYGVAVGGLFAGESMFYRRTDASKVALVELVRLLAEDGGGGGGGRFVDIQWATPHLERLGASELARTQYLDLLNQALQAPPPAAFSCDRAVTRGTM